MATFAPPRDRDACATVRGFVYQIDRTLERWLRLQPNQVLELERGEDIDTIWRAIGSEEDEKKRLLEQVKQRAKTVTLRSDEALEAVANALEHRCANPNIELAFRFSTNAPAGQERLSPLPGKQSALLAWERMRLGQVAADEEGRLLAGIRKILRVATKPKRLPVTTWACLQDFLEHADDLAFGAFVRSFEWGVRGPTAHQAEHAVKVLLLQQGRAADATRAEHQYHRLFLDVLKLLSSPGIKRLTVERLETALALPLLSPEDQGLLDGVVVRLCALESRTDALEERVQAHDQVLQELGVRLQIAAPTGLSTAVTYVAITPELDSPPLVSQFSRRRDTVTSLTAQMRRSTWTAIHGGVGSGKTQLAILIAQARGDCRGWISMRGLNTEEACLRLDASLAGIAKRPPPIAQCDRYAEFCEAITPGSLIVIDDLPRIIQQDELAQRLMSLARACHPRGVYLLSTSAYPLPSALQELPRALLLSVAAPSFTNAEASELLGAYGAPARVLKEPTVEFVNAVAKQHPTLLAAIARYLRDRAWRFTWEELDALVRGDHATPVAQEAIARLLVTVPRIEARELLYRLNLVNADFTVAEVDAVAAVAPDIERPREQLDALLGLFVQQGARSTMSVSPLVRKVGGGELPVHTREAVCQVLGDMIVRKNRIDQFEAVRAIGYYYAGKQYNRAAWLLMASLRSFLECGVPRFDAFLTLLWADHALPDEVDLRIRLLIRADQISLRHKAGHDVSWLIRDLEQLSQRATAAEGAVLYAAVISAMPAIAEKDVTNAHALLARALALLPTAVLPDGAPFRPPDGVRLEEAVWFTVPRIETPGQLRTWIDLVAGLTAEQRERAFSHSIAEDGCNLVAGHLWLREARKPEFERRWDHVLLAIHELIEAGRRHGMELLWASGIRARITVTAEFLKNLAQAAEIAQAALATASDDPRVRYLIEDAIGRQYVFAQQGLAGLRWLTSALAHDTTAYPGERVFTLLNASRAAGETDPQAAFTYAELAAETAACYAQVPERLAAQAEGELALALLLAGNRASAFDHMEQGVDRLLACREDTDGWKGALVLFGHATAYLARIALTGLDPQVAPESGPRVPPTRGFLVSGNGSRASLYRQSHECIISAQLAMCADALGKDDRAIHWAARAVDAARTTDVQSVIAAMSRQIIPHLLLRDSFEEALGMSIQAGRIAVASQLVHTPAPDVSEQGFDAEELLRGASTECRQQAEQYATATCLTAAAFRLATLTVPEFEGVRDAATEVVRVCRRIAVDSCIRDTWERAADLIERAFINGAAARDLAQQSQCPECMQEPALFLICCVGACCQRDTSLLDVFHFQMVALPYVSRFHPVSTTAYRIIVTPFVATYWRNAFRTQRFRFRSPLRVEQELSTAVGQTVTERPQAILRAVCTGLGAHPTREALNWLYGTSSGAQQSRNQDANGGKG